MARYDKNLELVSTSPYKAGNKNWIIKFLYSNIYWPHMFTEYRLQLNYNITWLSDKD